MSLLEQSLLLLLSLPIFKGPAKYSGSKQACESLYSTLPDQVVFPGTQAYEKSISSYTYIGTRLRPTCIVSPKSTDEVSVIINTLGSFDSVPFAIRSGGHNTNIGFADIEDGLTIDLSAMNAVQLSESTETVSVGPGARWQSVYETLEPYGLSVQGGRNGDVGVGGFLIGGGIGFFSPEKGWACDFVTNFEVVLSTGDIINANKTSHADLFTGLKGGQNNFGIVTRFDLKTISQGPLWGGVIMYSNSSDKELLDTFTSFKDPEKFDPYAMLTFGFTYDAVQRTSAADIAMYYSQPERVQGSTLESFANVQPQVFNSIRIASPGSFAGEKLSLIIKSYYMHWATATFTISRTALSRIHDLFQQTSITLGDNYPSANLTAACSLQSVPAAAPDSNPNSLGFNSSSNPEKNLVNIGIALQYEDAGATEFLQEGCIRLMKQIDKITEEEGVKDDHLYLNYAGSWQDVFAGYGSENLEKMRRVAKKYDERGMFQKQVRGGFKLFV